MNFYTDSSEWRYLFKNAVDWDNLIPLYQGEFPTSDGFKNREELLSFYEDILTSTGKWAAETIAPRAAELDRQGGGRLINGQVEISEPLRQTYQEAKELDVFGLTLKTEHGGMGLPATVGMFSFTQLCRACVSTSTQLGFFSSIADMIERFCTPEMQEKFIPMIRKGEISGSMCLTEPDAGSDVGALRTSAVKQADGTYLLNGTKCFITNGGGGLAFILARIPGAPQGLEGISMFFAQEWIENPTSHDPENIHPDNPTARKHNYRVAKIEEKMGMHGSPTCEIVYENTVGHLVGKENEGFNLMLFLMNEARISVGLQGLGGIEASLSLAKNYAETRKQFGKPLVQLPLMKRILQDLETERDALRALLVDTISHFDLFQKLHLKKAHTGDLNEKETNLLIKSGRIIRRRTPLVKYYGAEANTAISQKAIQVLGGYGFIAEYEVERLHRDSFGALLYEGTSQIQALMAMKDFVKSMLKSPGNFLQALIASHPIGTLMSESETEKKLASINYEFRKNVAALMMRCFKPELPIPEAGTEPKLQKFTEPKLQKFTEPKLQKFKDTLNQIKAVFKKEYWKDEDRFDRLMMHAETLCQALSYRETLKVLAQHATRDPAREELYQKYLKLVTPRLAGIYSDWKNSDWKN